MPLLVFAPVASGSGTSVPVVVFAHGFSSAPRFYSQMLTQIASHGYIVVGPQFPTSLSTDANPDIRRTAAVIQWLRANFTRFRPATPAADFSRLTLGGHSRGGKVTYGVALSLSGISAVGARAVFALDPVDGGGPSGVQSAPPILKYQQNSIKLNVPALVIGTGLGPVSRGFGGACAPAAFGPAHFYNDTASPAFHFRAKDYGHADMLDDSAGSSRLFCSSGGAPAPMRAFCAGTVVAFLNSVLKANGACFSSLSSTPSQFAIAVDQVLSK